MTTSPTEAIKAARRIEEADAIKKAQREQRTVTYIADDGCEITATPQGHIFYKVADWW